MGSRGMGYRVHMGHEKYKYFFLINLLECHFVGIDGNLIQKRIVSRMKGREADSSGS
jgi:hypothetical protein